MGLDMYLSGRKHFYKNYENPEANLMEDGFEVKVKELRLGYWRKHPNLHGYIVQTFANGVDECQEISLSPDDIRTIIKAIKDRVLPHTTGFFFGASDGSVEEMECDLEIFERALEWLETNEEHVSRSVEYQASW